LRSSETRHSSGVLGGTRTAGAVTRFVLMDNPSIQKFLS
jgi:hypothetical protein